jgi:hypothetical protein
MKVTITKSVQFAAMPTAGINDDIITPILNWVETIDDFRKRTFIAPKSNKTIVVPPSIPEDTEMVSLGDEEPYQNMTIEEEEALYFPDDAYHDNPGRDTDYTKYGDGLLTKLFTKLNHTVDMVTGMLVAFPLVVDAIVV